ncbi:MAG: UDP-glucose/GDP-mannose dehydrogenase family protein [Rickettsiaceae bacterium]|nr:UDP-glucose/GDP-mannose dehydrogenase family protein [Rickettsiaceae bacterium]
MKLGFVGAGYVGLVSGVMCAYIGHQVICIDKDLSKIERLNKGESIIYEKNLQEHLRAQVAQNNIIFSSEFALLKDCDAIFICVGTPKGQDGSADLTYAYSALLECAENVPDSCLLIIKSTVPPTSCENMQNLLKIKGFGHQIAANPEFLREGSAVSDFLNGDRIVAGGNSKSLETIKQIYAPLLDNGMKFLGCDTNTAELIKYSSNSFLAIKLSFINEISDLCAEINADISLLAKGVGLDKRIGELFLNAGPGYGGSCFPKDTIALSCLAKNYSVPSMVLDAAINSNLARYQKMADKIHTILQKPCIITALGLAFKEGTDDTRESPAIKILNILAEKGYIIQIYDPVVSKNFSNIDISNSNIYDNIEEACKNSHALAILTEWSEFSEINYHLIGKSMSEKRLIDLRLVCNVELAKTAGFDVYLLGKKHKL